MIAAVRPRLTRAARPRTQRRARPSPAACSPAPPHPSRQLCVPGRVEVSGWMVGGGARGLGGGAANAENLSSAVHSEIACPLPSCCCCALPWPEQVLLFAPRLNLSPACALVPWRGIRRWWSDGRGCAHRPGVVRHFVGRQPLHPVLRFAHGTGSSGRQAKLARGAACAPPNLLQWGLVGSAREAGGWVPSPGN